MPQSRDKYANVFWPLPLDTFRAANVSWPLPLDRYHNARMFVLHSESYWILEKILFITDIEENSAIKDKEYFHAWYYYPKQL